MQKNRGKKAKKSWLDGRGGVIVTVGIAALAVTGAVAYASQGVLPDFRDAVDGSGHYGYVPMPDVADDGFVKAVDGAYEDWNVYSDNDCKLMKEESGHIFDVYASLDQTERPKALTYFANHMRDMDPACRTPKDMELLEQMQSYEG